MNEPTASSDVVHDVVQDELQQLLIEASQIKKSMDEAKTALKRDYYKKKFDNVNTKILQMTAALEILSNKQDKSVSPSATTFVPVSKVPAVKPPKSDGKKGKMITKTPKRASGGGSRQFTT